jgi:hypothetical protein
MSADPTPEVETPPVEAETKPAAKAKKPPKAAQPDKPFPQLIQEDLIPVTLKALQKRGVTDAELKLEGKVLLGSFNNGRRLFNVLFADESLEGSKLFACATEKSPLSTVESFMIDERKPGVDLVAFYIVQRLYAQQWF